MDLEPARFLNKKKCLIRLLSVYIYGYIWARVSVAPKRLYKFYSYSAFNSLCAKGRCPVNEIKLAPIIRFLQIEPPFPAVE
jgi:hypothetical protein